MFFSYYDRTKANFHLFRLQNKENSPIGEPVGEDRGEDRGVVALSY